MTPEEARSRFATARVARLATAGGDGAPHIVPITFAMDGDRVVTAVDAKPKRGSPLRRLANIRANPRVSLLADEYDDDWGKLWWVRADGEARIVGEDPGLGRALALLRARYAQYAALALVGPAVVIDVVRWVGWSASEG